MVAQRTCGATEHQEQLLENPVYAKWFNQYKKQIRTADHTRNVSCSNPLIIPVAVHYNGSVNTSNTSCLISRALDQVAVMNADFGAYNSDINNYCSLSESCCSTYPPEVISRGTCLQFCLATMNHPACEPAGNLIGGYAITVGEHEWPSASNNCWKGYLNIFVSDEDPPGQTNLLGLAPIGGAANPNGNGMFVAAFAFGGLGSGCTSGTGIDVSGTYNLGRTGTHEAGHYFGLDHIFNGCSNGDGIADTPDQELENYGCPTVNTTSCTSDAENTCSTQDFFFNYMDYVNDACMYMFTENQGDLMYATAQVAGTGANEPFKSNVTVCDMATQPSYNPTYPNGCVLSNPPVPDSDFEPLAGSIIICTNKPIFFTNKSDACVQSSWAWTFTGAGVTTSSSSEENPSVYITQSGTLTVTLATTNSSGTDLTPASKSYTITVIDSNDPSCNQCGSTFTDSGGVNGNYTNDEMITTTLCSPLSSSVNVQFVSFRVEQEPNCMYDGLEVYDGPTAASDFMGRYCGVGVANAPGGGSISSTNECLTFVFSSDQLVTDSGWEANVSCSTVVPIELNTFTTKLIGNSIELSWEAASEINLTNYSLERSRDGKYFNEIAVVAGKGMATTVTYDVLDENLEIGKYYYRLKQNYRSGKFDYSQMISEEIRSTDIVSAYKIFPNPTTGVFNLESQENLEFPLELSVYGRMGNLVKQLQVYSDSKVVRVNLEDLLDGVYTLHINSGDKIQIETIVILN